MAFRLSVFQILPLLVMENIIEYLEGRPKDIFYLNIDDHMFKAALVSLVFVSKHWRITALASICDNCALRYDSYCDTIDVCFPAWPADFSYPQFDKNSHVNHIVVNVTTWLETQDEAFDALLARTECRDVVLPYATTLELRLDKPLYGKPGKLLKNGKSREASFACSLLRAVPAAANVIVTIRFTDYRKDKYHDPYNLLVSELCQANAKALSVHSKSHDILLSLDLHGASELTSITHDIDGCYDTFAKLAYRNRHSLKTLRIRLSKQDN
ncbi:hypothetical protein GGI20_003309 [Coemansia sp. BCRC 34301]|nr:hypothetical protein GGI20_003309 [Coemansia sp. BCRC 34301]